jgi:predicted RNase H-like nuclease (RuvC/YqgF family)
VRGASRTEGVQKMMERRRTGRARSPKEDFAQSSAASRSRSPAAQANVDRLTAEEAQLTQDVTTEQARWIDINQRLDELERALAKH